MDGKLGITPSLAFHSQQPTKTVNLSDFSAMSGSSSFSPRSLFSNGTLFAENPACAGLEGWIFDTPESLKEECGIYILYTHLNYSSCCLPIHTMQVCVTLDHLSAPQPVSKLNLKAMYPSTMELLRFAGRGPVPHMLLIPQCHPSNQHGSKYHFPHRL